MCIRLGDIYFINNFVILYCCEGFFDGVDVLKKCYFVRMRFWDEELGWSIFFELCEEWDFIFVKGKVIMWYLYFMLEVFFLLRM